MANRACKYCGGRVNWKNEANHYRDFCRKCAEAIADGHELRDQFETDMDPRADPHRPYEDDDGDT